MKTSLFPIGRQSCIGPWVGKLSGPWTPLWWLQHGCVEEGKVLAPDPVPPLPPWFWPGITSRDSVGMEAAWKWAASQRSGLIATGSWHQQSTHVKFKSLCYCPFPIFMIFVVVVHICTIYVFLCLVYYFFPEICKSLQCSTAFIDPLSMPFKTHPASQTRMPYAVWATLFCKKKVCQQFDVKVGKFNFCPSRYY